MIISGVLGVAGLADCTDCAVDTFISGYDTGWIEATPKLSGVLQFYPALYSH